MDHQSKLFAINWNDLLIFVNAQNAINVVRTLQTLFQINLIVVGLRHYSYQGGYMILTFYTIHVLPVIVFNGFRMSFENYFIHSMLYFPVIIRDLKIFVFGLMYCLFFASHTVYAIIFAYSYFRGFGQVR